MFGAGRASSARGEIAIAGVFREKWGTCSLALIVSEKGRSLDSG